MTIIELEDRLKPETINYLIGQDKLKSVGNNVYHLNPCPVCNHKDHFTVYSETNSYTSFSGCTTGGGVFKYLTEIEGLTKDEARDKLQELAGVLPDNIKEFTNQKEEVAPVESEPEQPQKKYTDLINELYDKQLPETKTYFNKRGIGQSLIDKYKLSLFNDSDGKRVMLPIWKDEEVVYFTKRALDGQEPRYKNAAGATILFNIDELDKAEAGDTVIITEGTFDALTVEENTGLKAVAIGGIQHYKKAQKSIEQAQDRGVIILAAFDNDEAGRKLTSDTGLPSIDIPSNYKDLNDWGIQDPIGVKEKIVKTIELKQRPNSANNYLENNFLKAIEEFKQYQGRTTGFKNLDYYLGGFFPGLYIIGGVSSVGKTTFAHQLGDQLAEQGDHVLYFSLEQSTFEMISKSIARETAKIELEQGGDIKALRKAVTNINIRSGNKSEIINKAISNYKSAASRVNIIEGNFDLNVEKIQNKINQYMKINKVKPVVIIDYLQILPGDPRMNDKTRIDRNVTDLKKISRDLNIVVIVISSLNRASYLTPVTFEAFKESGGIEYTADVVIGLQLHAVKEKPRAGESNDPTIKQEILRVAKEEIPRKIELVCLKNRNGRTFSCSFKYNQMFDYYTPETAPSKPYKRL